MSTLFYRISNEYYLDEIGIVKGLKLIIMLMSCSLLCWVLSFDATQCLPKELMFWLAGISSISK